MLFRKYSSKSARDTTVFRLPITACGINLSRNNRANVFRDIRKIAAPSFVVNKSLI
jgi:hypothetical protein